MGDIVVHKLSPLHQHQSVLLILLIVGADGSGRNCSRRWKASGPWSINTVLVLRGQQALQLDIGLPPGGMINVVTASIKRPVL